MTAHLVIPCVLALLGAASCATRRVDRLASLPQPFGPNADASAATVQELRHTIDSLQAENDSLRRERAELAAALKRLREIDLRSRTPRQ